MSKAQFRRLVVRAIEDGCLFLFLIVCVWLVCSGASLLLSLLGVV